MVNYQNMTWSWVGNEIDNDTTDWNALMNVPADIADGDADTVLTESEVENYVVNGGLDFDVSSTLGGAQFVTSNDATLHSTQCAEGEISFNRGSLVCTTPSVLFDADSDGIMA